MFTRRSRGFTLVELLVVIAIIAMLVGILLPAVNAARAAGRRTQNSNNLKNIGLAVLSHHESKNAYPAMRYIGNRATAKAGKNYPKPRMSVSWAFELLPYMEQSNIYDKFDKTRAVFDPANALAMSSLIPIYANPQQGEARATCPFAGGGSGTGTCVDYAANRGIYFADNQNKEDQYTMSHANNQRNIGPFIHNSAVTQAHVKDGQSQTIAIGDKWVMVGSLDQAGLTGSASEAIMRGPHARGGGDTPITFIDPGGLFPSRDDASTQKFGGPSGTGDTMALCFLDGHVEWIQYSIDPFTFAYQLTIDGNEVIQDE